MIVLVRCVASFRYTSAHEAVMRRFAAETIDFFDNTEIYVFRHRGVEVCFTYIGIGSPLAVLDVELLFALGVKRIVVFGGVIPLSPSFSLRVSKPGAD